MTETIKKKKRKKNPIIRYFVPFGMKQISEIALIIGAILMFIGFFVTQVVQLIGVFIVLFAALVGIVRATLILIKNKSDKKNPNFKSGISLMVFWAIITIISIIGIIFYFV